MNYLTLLTQGGASFLEGNPVFVILIYCVFIFGAMWLIQRPQKKREQALKNLQDCIKIGDNVVLHSGIFGTVVDLADDCVMLEIGTNKTLRLPVLRYSIADKKTADFSIKKAVEEKTVKEEAPAKSENNAENVVND